MSRIVVNSREVEAGLSRLSNAVTNPKPALNAIGNYGAEITKLAFDEHAEPGGAAWKPLSARYRAWKVKNRYHDGPLTKTSRLKRSVHFVVTGQRSVAWGDSTHYGRYHQQGRGVPERRYLNVAAEHERDIGDIWLRWLQREV